jgi:hypothetical protein
VKFDWSKLTEGTRTTPEDWAALTGWRQICHYSGGQRNYAHNLLDDHRPAKHVVVADGVIVDDGLYQRAVAAQMELAQTVPGYEPITALSSPEVIARVDAARASAKAKAKRMREQLAKEYAEGNAGYKSDTPPFEVDEPAIDGALFQKLPLSSLPSAFEARL